MSVYAPSILVMNYDDGSGVCSINTSDHWILVEDAGDQKTFVQDEFERAIQFVSQP